MALEKFSSLRELNRDFAAFFNTVFGPNLLPPLLPWQGRAIQTRMGQSAITGPRWLPGPDVYVSRHGVFELIPNKFTRRPVRPEAYWQWKNGKIAPLFGDEANLRVVTGAYEAWDRSLGCRVVYAAH